MDDDLLPPLIPSSRDLDPRRGPAGASGVPRLPLANVEQLPERTVIYAIRPVHENGYASISIISADMGWRDGESLSWLVVGGLIVVSRNEIGPGRTATNLGRLTVPVAARRAVGVEVGDQLFIAADPASGLLIIYPPRLLDALLARPFGLWPVR